MAIAAIETWLPALLGYLIPLGLFLMAWGGMEPRRARRVTTAGSLALALAVLGYFAVGFAFHLGGAGVVSGQPGLEDMKALYALGGEKEWGMIGLAGFFLADEAATPEAMVLFVNYLPMVATAVLLVAMSVSGQARWWQVALGGLVVAAVIFPIAACWTWGGGWLSNLGSDAVLERGHGFVDHSGSAVVYLLGGMAALGALVGLGWRLPRSEPGQPEEMPPVHFPLLANLGALLFGLGWLGWSLSVPFHVAGAGLNLPRIAVNGLLAGAGAILTSQAYCWFVVGHADPLMSARGAVVGFVAVSAGAPFMPPLAALGIGALAGLLLPLGVYLVDRVLRLSDGTAAVSLGIAGGLLGSLAVAVFADGRWGQGWNGIGWEEYHTVAGQGVTGIFPADGFLGDGPGQLVAQLVGIGAIGLVAFLVSWLVFLALNAPYRPRRERKPKPTVVEEALEAEPALEAPPEAPIEAETPEVEAPEVPEAEAEEEKKRRPRVKKTKKAAEAEAEVKEPEPAPQPEEGVAELESVEAAVEAGESEGGNLLTRLSEMIARWTEFVRR
jgi:Amt family ammonium transporter